MIKVTHKLYGSTEITYFDNFNSLKRDVIKLLDNRGWDNKESVDMRSIKSCVNYLFENVIKIEVKR